MRDGEGRFSYNKGSGQPEGKWEGRVVVLFSHVEGLNTRREESAKTFWMVIPAYINALASQLIIGSLFLLKQRIDRDF